MQPRGRLRGKGNAAARAEMRTVAAVLEAERIELVLARGQRGAVDADVPVDVPGRVAAPVDADEGAQAVVGVHAEGVVAGRGHTERDPDVEADVLGGAVGADVVVRERLFYEGAWSFGTAMRSAYRDSP